MNVEDKSTEELFNLLKHYAERHRQARDARDPGRQRTDTQMDELMQKTLERNRLVEEELLDRGAIEFS